MGEAGYSFRGGLSLGTWVLQETVAAGDYRIVDGIYGGIFLA